MKKKISFVIGLVLFTCVIARADESDLESRVLTKINTDAPGSSASPLAQKHSGSNNPGDGNSSNRSPASESSNSLSGNHQGQGLKKISSLRKSKNVSNSSARPKAKAKIPPRKN